MTMAPLKDRNGGGGKAYGSIKIEISQTTTEDDLLEEEPLLSPSSSSGGSSNANDESMFGGLWIFPHLWLVHSSVGMHARTV
jgi:hypothetical protein